MTRLLLVILGIMATATYAEILEPLYKIHDPLVIDPNTHPRDTLRFYINNLTNYIYNTEVGPNADPRAAFFNQNHQLRIYETLNHYVEQNYGSTLKEILNNDHHIENKLNDATKGIFVEMIIDLERRVGEMFLQVTYSSGDKPVDQERLKEVQMKKRKLVETYAKFATLEQVAATYRRIVEIDVPVLDNFNKTIWGQKAAKLNVKREAHLDDENFHKDLNGYLKKLTAYVYNVSEVEFLSAKMELNINPLGSAISLKRFIEANYRKYLEQQPDVSEISYKQEKVIEIEEIKQIEEKTTALWFEAVNYANLELLKNETIINDINAAIAARLDEYMQFRTLEEIKETNRRIHEVYGHLLKDCDQSSYLILVNVFKELSLSEYYGKEINESATEKQENIEKLIKYSEAMWQTNHGMSVNEKKRVRSLLETINGDGIKFLLTIYGNRFWRFSRETNYEFDPQFFNLTDFQLHYNEKEFSKLIKERYDFDNNKHFQRFFVETLGFYNQLGKLYIERFPNRFTEAEKEKILKRNMYEEMIKHKG